MLGIFLDGVSVVAAFVAALFWYKARWARIPAPADNAGVGGYWAMYWLGGFGGGAWVSWPLARDKLTGILGCNRGEARTRSASLCRSDRRSGLRLGGLR